MVPSVLSSKVLLRALILPLPRIAMDLEAAAFFQLCLQSRQLCSRLLGPQWVGAEPRLWVSFSYIQGE